MEKVNIFLDNGFFLPSDRANKYSCAHLAKRGPSSLFNATNSTGRS